MALPFSAHEMTPRPGGFATTIPSEETDTPFTLAYRLGISDGRGHARRHPGLGEDLASRPYFVLRRIRA